VILNEKLINYIEVKEGTKGNLYQKSKRNACGGNSLDGR
jgi:hypothetical protein